VDLLRIGRRSRWGLDRDATNSEDVTETSRDLRLAADEEGLSVFRVLVGAHRSETAWSIGLIGLFSLVAAAVYWWMPALPE
jgi:hypothetical protein